MVRMDFHGRDGNTAQPVSIGGRLGLSLFLFFFLMMGLLFEALVVRQFCRAGGQRMWAKVPCRIVSSEVQEQNSSESPFILAVNYEYVYGGATHTGSTYKRSYSGSGSYTKEQQRAQGYPAGMRTFCYVNPAHPAAAVLQRESLFIGLVVFFPLIFIAIGGGGILLVWRKPVSEAEKPIARTAIASQARSRYSRYGLAVFFALFAALGGGLLYPLGIRPIARTIAAESWVATPCQVLRAEVRSHDSDDGTTYSVYVLYQYEFNGQIYKSDRFGFVSGSSSGYDSKARIVERYKAAVRPICYVNPRVPAEAVLQRGFRASLLVVLFPLVFLLVGVVGIVGALRHKGHCDPVAGLRYAHRTSRTADASMCLLRVPDAAPATLKPQHSPGIRLTGALLIALFWNGILSVFLIQVVDGFRHGSANWLLTFFLTPFVVIGLALLGIVLHQFLAMFNPRPTLELSSGTVPLGGVVELRWNFTGRTSRVREFSVTLHGIEETKYRQGTSTYTDRNVFYEMELYRTSNPGEIAAGQIGFVMPQDTVHSFEAENNKLIWSVDVHGDVPGWPDVKESFRINVTPMPTQRIASV